MLMALCVFSVNSAPVIEVNNEVYDCGIFIEGKDAVGVATFNIRNSGDSSLKIASVRPGCGCVVAAFDTVIPPGKSGKVKLEARLSGYSGEIVKSATVTSNAENQPQLRLTLKGKILPVIALSKQYIALISSDDHKSGDLFLSSLKKDLKITGITFKSHDQNHSAWSGQLSLPITYEWTRTDSISPEGFTVFRLLIKGPDLKESIDGNFILSTNHPDKNEIQISGRIESN
jgi:hypothetical protein